MKNSEKAKSERLHKRVSGQLRLPLAFILASQRVFLRVLVWRSEATPLVYAKHTPWCQTVKISEFIIVLPIIFLDRISSI